MLEMVLMLLGTMQLADRCRKAGRAAGGPMALFIVTWVISELMGFGVLFLLGLEQRFAVFGAMLVGITGGAVAYLSIVRSLPKPKK